MIKSGDYNKIKEMQDRYKDEVSIQFQVARMYFNNRKYDIGRMDEKRIR